VLKERFEKQTRADASPKDGSKAKKGRADDSKKMKKKKV
jgi:hypothetical protein